MLLEVWRCTDLKVELLVVRRRNAVPNTQHHFNTKLIKFIFVDLFNFYIQFLLLVKLHPDSAEELSLFVFTPTVTNRNPVQSPVCL